MLKNTVLHLFLLTPQALQTSPVAHDKTLSHKEKEKKLARTMAVLGLKLSDLSVLLNCVDDASK